MRRDAAAPSIFGLGVCEQFRHVAFGGLSSAFFWLILFDLVLTWQILADLGRSWQICVRALFASCKLRRKKTAGICWERVPKTTANLTKLQNYDPKSIINLHTKSSTLQSESIREKGWFQECESCRTPGVRAQLFGATGEALAMSHKLFKYCKIL